MKHYSQYYIERVKFSVQFSLNSARLLATLLVSSGAVDLILLKSMFFDSASFICFCEKRGSIILMCPIYFATRKEFFEGCKAIQADSLEGICSRFPCMLLDAQGEENFKDLYRFTFQFGLDAEEGQRSLQRDIAIALWRLVFTQDTPAILEHWLDFLAENPSGIRGISRDTWNMFLNFTQAIGPDLSNYSEDEAWPSLFDTFVDWELERRKKEEEQALMVKEEEGRCIETEYSPTTDRLETEGSRGSQTWGGH